MKKFVLILSLSLLNIVGADWIRVIGTSESPLPPEKIVVKSDTTGVLIRTTVFGFTKEDTTVDQKDFKRIEIPEEQVDVDTTRAGKPQIPFVRLQIAIPDSCELDINVYPSDYTLFEDYLLYPVPQIVFEADTFGAFYPKEVFTYDTSFYQKDTLYPDKFYEINDDGYWRDQRILELFLYPVQFNPLQNRMCFYVGIDIRIDYSGKVFENEKGLGPFEDIGRRILLNYPGIDQETPPHEPSVHYYTDLLNPNNVADYIIVTHDDFLHNRIAADLIDEFAHWRVDHNQFDVGIVSMIDVYDEFLDQDSAKALRDFLIYAYEEWQALAIPDGHFAYCLFIGDWDYVPTKLYEWGEWLAADEEYFRNLMGGHYDDIMLGRWPVKKTNVQDLITIGQKTINYEKYPTLRNWRRRGLLIAGDSGFEGYIDVSKPYFSDIGYDTFTVRPSQFGQEPIPFVDTVNHYLNQGEILTAYFGHGGPEEWQNDYDTTEVKNLRNGSRLPVVLSCPCFTAMFQWDHPFYDTHHSYPGGTSFGEHFLINPDGGTVAFWGATIFSFMPPWSTILCEILRYQNWILGKGLISLRAPDYCLLGDPALDLGDYTAYPNLPDLIVRPHGIDISLLPPYPYPNSGDAIRIRAKILNIGGATAHNIGVKFEVGRDGTRIYDTTITISSIQPRDSAIAIAYWNTVLSHPNYYGEIGDCEFTVEADPNDEIDESWEYNNESSMTKKVALYPYQAGWPKKIGVSQPAIGNIDGGGTVEIVWLGMDSVYVFNYDGSIFHGWPQYFKGGYAVVLGDVDCRGNIEIVAVSPDSIKVYDYQGNIMPGWPQAILDPAKHFEGLPAIGYISGSDKRQIVVFVATPRSSTPLQLKVLVYNYNGNLLYSFNTSTGAYDPRSAGPSISDVNGDGINEIVLSYNIDIVGSEMCKTDIFNRSQLDPIITLDYGSGKMISALADLDNDGYAEVIAGAEDKNIRAYKATTGETLWTTETRGAIKSSPAVGDIHPLFDTLEITVGNDAREIWAIRDVSGFPWLPWPITVGGWVQTSPALARLTSTGSNVDIVIGSRDQYIYAFTYEGDTIPPYPLPLFGSDHSSPVIGDIDGDRKSEIILTSNDGYLHVWENRDSEVLPYLLEWPQFHHDYQRTGLYGW